MKLPSSEESQILPIWVAHGYSDVFNMDRPPSSMNNTDVGSWLLLARGHRQAKFTDIPVRNKYKKRKSI